MYIYVYIYMYTHTYVYVCSKNRWLVRSCKTEFRIGMLFLEG